MNPNIFYLCASYFIFLPFDYKHLLYVSLRYKIPYFSIDNAHVIYTKRSKFVKNEHALYTLEIWNLKNLEMLITATSQARF